MEKINMDPTERDWLEDERQALFLFNNMKGMLSDKLLKICEYFGSAREAYEQDADVFFACGLFRKEELRTAFEAMKKQEALLLKRYDRLKQQGVRMIIFSDPDYPERLQHIPDRPPLLYVCGRLPDDARPSAGIIGSRKCSEYGRSVAEYFAGELARRGIQIVSGLAYGIDGAAAAGSLRTASESYGVLGCGVNICYPRENWQLYHRMKQGKGGILSEFPPDDDALGFHFILRNRLISGFSDVLLVMEAGERSGTSTTVEYALSQGKEVFALPGRITDPLGFGCNRLLKDGANVLTSPSDILDYFGMEEGRTLKMGEKDLSRLNPAERRICKALSFEPRHIEMIAAQCGMELADALQTLSGLEARGYVFSPRGAYYQKVV